MSPSILEEDIERVSEVLRSGMLTQGTRVAALERKLAALVGVPHVIGAANGTATLHLALAALDIGPGDEVIVPSFSHIATANVVELVGARPVFVDIELRTFNIDAAKIEVALTPRTRAIIPVHEFGLPCDIQDVCEIANAHGLSVIEDAACALGATEADRPIGSFGDMASFSLHPRKVVTSGEGGLLAVRDPAVAERIAVLRNHGLRGTGAEHEFVEAGFNYRLADIGAALAASQLDRLPAALEKKRQLADVYFTQIRNSRIVLPRPPEGKRHTWQTFHVLLDPELDRRAVIERLAKRGVGTNYGAQCLPAQAYYQRKYGEDCEARYPNGLAAWRRGLAIPMYEKLQEDDVARVADIVNKEI